ncbi:MAG: cation-translocating P-type ATPase [Phycisphaerae bacterium]|nr:cation-translocating P-type ATPase [Phycisphaerae bacterium]
MSQAAHAHNHAHHGHDHAHCDHDHKHDHGHDHGHHDHDHGGLAHTHDLFSVNTRIVLTLIGGMLLVAAMAAQSIPADWGWGIDPKFHGDSLALVAALLLATPLIITAFVDLLRGHSHMDELIAIGVLAAMAMSEYLAAGAVAFFMLIGQLIESRTAIGARKSIESLVRIAPTRASKLVGGQEIDCDAKDLRPGDRVRVRPGDNIPGDGRIISGASTVNQANITGESVPVDKSAGEEVFGGTINLTGVMEIEITKAGRDTTLGKVQEMILQAERTRTPIMRLTDRYAAWYTPIVLMLAGIVLLLTKDANRAISMLLISCPCALILATPTALVAALGAAARLGVLIKNVGDLEVARNLTAIMFDKTGTLTTGKLNVTRLKPAAGVDAAHLLWAAASAEQNSRHPVARAIVAVARKANINLDETGEAEEIAGRGVRAVLQGREILVGRASWLRERNIDVDGLEATNTEGLSLLYVTDSGKLLGWIGLEDKTRVDASRAMDALREDGIKHLVMVTGDRWTVARKVAAEMHCTDVQAEVLPGQKLAIVDQLKRDGHTVAVVGDGVNDAPALAAGNISIAMGAAGSDVAIHSASVALMNNNLNRIPFLVRLSRLAVSVIWQNMIFGVAYVALLLVLSAAGYVHPVLAAFLHAASSLVVVFNSARLIRAGEDVDTLPAEEEDEQRQRVQMERVPAGGAVAAA